MSSSPFHVTSPMNGASTSSTSARIVRTSSCIGRPPRLTANMCFSASTARGSTRMSISRRTRTGKTVPCYRPLPVRALFVKAARSRKRIRSKSAALSGRSAVPIPSRKPWKRFFRTSMNPASWTGDSTISPPTAARALSSMTGSSRTVTMPPTRHAEGC